MVGRGLGDAANFLAAAAPDYSLVLISRIMVGVTIGGFWSIGAGLAERLMPPASVGRATAVIFSAVPLGSVLGVPTGTLIGELAGWRTAFIVMGALTAGVLVMLLLLVPPLPPVQATRLGALGGMLRSVKTRFALLLTFLVVLAHFGTYTYLPSFFAVHGHAARWMHRGSHGPCNRGALRRTPHRSGQGAVLT